MTSSGRELLKWIALVLMTGDHVAKAFYGGYVPVISEAGRIAFPLFAVVMAYNLARPDADTAKSIRRLLGWGAVAQPFHAIVFGYWLPLNVLLTFALSALVIRFAQQRLWVPFAASMLMAPILVDYQWAGVWLVVSTWALYDHVGRYKRCRVMIMDRVEGIYSRSIWLAAIALVMLCVYNGNAWALLFGLLPPTVGKLDMTFPRGRWAFYGYYVGHLAVIAVAISVTRYAV